MKAPRNDTLPLDADAIFVLGRRHRERVGPHQRSSAARGLNADRNVLTGLVVYQTGPVGGLQFQRADKCRFILDMSDAKHTPAIGQFTGTESLLRLLPIARHERTG